MRTHPDIGLMTAKQHALISGGRSKTAGYKDHETEPIKSLV